MDMFMVDVTDIEDVTAGDEVILIGTQGTERISTDEMAGQLGTINYEITCLVGKRVPRVYCKERNIIAVQSLLGYREN
jgi:alanine racemase